MHPQVIRLLVLSIFYVGIFKSSCIAKSNLQIGGWAQIAPLKKEVEQVFHNLQLPGLAVVVMKNKDILHDQALGYANLETNEVLTTDHLFWTASVTKAFTAALFLKSETQGKFKLDDPIFAFGVDRYVLPARVNKNISLRHLLTQTSEGEEPGKNFVYSFRYNWLVAPFNGSDAYEMALNNMLDSLNIEGLIAGYHRIKDFNAKVVVPHRFDKEKGIYEPSWNDRWETVIPATNLLATPKGLAIAGQVLNSGLGLPEKSSDLLNGSLELDNIQDDSYGYGSFVSTIEGKRIIWQYGFGGAESALFVRIPSDSISIAILSNSADLSGVTRLGSGDFLKHPLADALLRHVILTELDLESSLDWERPLEEIDKCIISRSGNSLDAHALLTQALVNYLKPTPNKERSKKLLDLAAKHYPITLSEASEPILWLMVQFADLKYEPFVNKQLNQALKTNHLHPWYIGLGAEFYDAIRKKDMAISYWLRNCNNIHFREHSQISDACLSLALTKETDQSEEAVDLAWKALDMASWSFSWERNEEARSLIYRMVLD